MVGRGRQQRGERRLIWTAVSSELSNAILTELISCSSFIDAASSGEVFDTQMWASDFAFKADNFCSKYASF